jgi:hypothetical protein
MSPFNENPFAVMTLIAAPAIMTNAASVLTLGTSNRLGRVVDRSRELAKMLHELDPGSRDYEVRNRQLERLQRRSKTVVKALTAFYFAIGCFAVAALVSLIGATLASSEYQFVFRGAAGAGLVIGTLAVGALATGCTLLVVETRLAVINLAEEAELARRAIGSTRIENGSRPLGVGE